MQSSKLTTELTDLLVFDRCSQVLRGAVVCLTERPDFMAQIGDALIGIEHTRLYRDAGASGSKDRARYAQCQKIADRVATALNATDGTPTHVNVIFNDRARFTKDDVYEVADQIVTSIVTAQLAPGDTLHLAPTWLAGEVFPEKVDYMSAIALQELEESTCGATGGGWFGTTSHEFLQDAITRKSATARQFDANVDELWLLLVLRGEVQASMIKIHDTAEQEVYEAEFDRVFVFEGYSGRWARLHVSQESKRSGT